HPPLADVSYALDEPPFLPGLHRAQADLYGKFRAILSHAVQIQPHAHRTCMWTLLIAHSLSDVRAAIFRWHQHLHFSAQQFRTQIPEHAFPASVHEDDR